MRRFIFLSSLVIATTGDTSCAQKPVAVLAERAFMQAFFETLSQTPDQVNVLEEHLKQVKLRNPRWDINEYRYGEKSALHVLLDTFYKSLRGPLDQPLPDFPCDTLGLLLRWGANPEQEDEKGRVTFLERVRLTYESHKPGEVARWDEQAFTFTINWMNNYKK